MRSHKEDLLLCTQLSRSAGSNRAVWRVGEVSPVTGAGTGCLRAKFDVGRSVTSQGVTAAVQFLGEGSTLSGVDFELAHCNYRVSLVKKRFLTGSFSCKHSQLLFTLKNLPFITLLCVVGKYLSEAEVMK